HLRSLETKGYLKREARLSRGLEVIRGGRADEPPSAPHDPSPAASPPGPAADGNGRLVPIPLIGRVAAGAPVLAAENIEDTLYLDRFFVREGETFALQVKGTSMINAGIFDGDYVFVQQQPVADRGQIVVALLGEEATVKTYYPEKAHIRLQPENDTMQPILVRRDDPDVRIVGRVTALLRKL
ncbi:MAG: transcriptional repressor LexA, partial [Chloroflexota bacterium]